MCVTWFVVYCCTDWWRQAQVQVKSPWRGVYLAQENKVRVSAGVVVLGSVRVIVTSGAAVWGKQASQFSHFLPEENLMCVRFKAHFIEILQHILLSPSIMTDGAQISLAHSPFLLIWPEIIVAQGNADRHRAGLQSHCITARQDGNLWIG